MMGRMAKSISPRFGLTRWTADPDTWSRAEIDANFAQIEAHAAGYRSGTIAARGNAQLDGELYWATDTGGTLYFCLTEGSSAWHQVAMLDGPSQQFINNLSSQGSVFGGSGSYFAGLLGADRFQVSGDQIVGAMSTVSFATESARDGFYSGSNFGGIMGVPICRLTAPTAGKPGLYFYDGARWRAVGGQSFYAQQTSTQTIDTTSRTILFAAPANPIDTTAGAGGWNPATGTFTAPYAGNWEVSATVAITGAATATQQGYATLKRSGTIVAHSGFVTAGGAGQDMTCHITPIVVALTAGQTLLVTGQTASGTTAGTYPSATKIRIQEMV